MQKRIYAIKENALKQYKIIPEHAKSINLLSSSFIQTILSALEFHQIMPFGSWAIPPVELHPALKIVIQLRTIIISDIISVNKSFSRLSKYNNLQAGKHRLFLILLFETPFPIYL